MRIAVSINTSWNIVNFRMSLLRALQAEGHTIIAIAPTDAFTPQLTAAGFEFAAVHMQNKGTNPIKDLQLIWQYYQIYKRTRPDVILNYTIKPNIYGTLAAKLAGVPVINNVSGLGTVFIIRNMVSKIAIGLYKFAFRYANKVFFQNQDDKKLFIENNIVQPAQTDVLPGSGVNLEWFRPSPAPVNQPFTFLMIARLLYEKGVQEFLEAARIVKSQHPEVVFQLLGNLDEAGNIGIKRPVLEQWISEGIVDYLGSSTDVRPQIAAANCVVLPSYREGTPKTLLEAAAMAKPIITTNVPGCREPVADGVNGYLCEVKSSPDLAQKILAMLNLSPSDRDEMSKQSRRIAETRFDEQIVIKKYITAIAEVTAK